MKIITDGKSLSNLIIQLIDKHDKFAFAVAWANADTNVMKTIIKNKEKIRHSVIGTHFYQTDPEVLNIFVDFDPIHFRLQPSGVFHPKSYIFWTEKSWDIIIGSANMTNGAFNKNKEIMIHISSESTDQHTNLKNELCQTIKTMWSDGIKMHTIYADNYKNLNKLHRHKLVRLSSEYTSNKKGNFSPVTSKIMSISWHDFFKHISNDPNHGFKGRCEILKIANNLFSTKRFFDMTLSERKAIAGFSDNFLNLDWKWFGSMVGAGVFHNRIIENDIHISQALDFIPLHDSITYENYNNYINEFVKSFPDGRDGVGVASRLLAMKRPDYFIGYNKGNSQKLCQDLGITLLDSNDYDRYWNDIIIKILDSVWWHSQPPIDINQLSAWKGRVAMLDAIFYLA